MSEHSSQEVEQALKEAMNGFNPSDAAERTALTRHITVWVTEETKELYDLVQSECKHRFTKTLRDVMYIAIKDAATKLNC